MEELKLIKLNNILKSQIDNGRINYVVPDLWNAWDYNGEELRKLPSNELLINPYRFYSKLIEEYLLPKSNPNINYDMSLSQIKKENSNGDWLKKASIYSSLIRTSSAWDHDRSFSLDLNNFDNIKETGTFIKMLAYLPTLKKIGINTITLLPVTKIAKKHNKGELGSPYAVKNFFELDQNLKSSLTNDKMSVDDEFKCFIEACHILEIRVVIDYIPRTNAIANDLIKDHPEWFYWIKASEASNYQVPIVEELSSTIPPDEENMKIVYKSKNIEEHINKFAYNPKEQNPKLFEKISDNSEDILVSIEKHFNLKIAPAFSDHINDNQPPWSDVTFFRMYFDHPKTTKKYLKNLETPPYILFDTIKANIFPGEKPNKELWKMLKNIIPYFQKNFGIDGARIDMGHALPKELLQMIFAEAKAIDSDFGFIAEELNPANAKKAKELGYNIIIGNGFWMEPRIEEKKLQEFVHEAHKYPLPMLGSAETHDSARVAGRENGRVLSRMLTILNMFLPNMVPFINSGQEVYETQPMNLGVDCTENDLYNLPKDDLFYKKLALFDKYAIHYLNINRWELIDHLDGVKNIRKAWLNEITSAKCYVPIKFDNSYTDALGVSYCNYKNNNCLLVICNTNLTESIYTEVIINNLREKSHNYSKQGRLLYATDEFGKGFNDFNEYGNVYLNLNPGEVKIIEF
ncbi:MAG: alpha-amylase [Candidatus Izimaplasma sp.]|nr:alpha-amylase [Candidatus Izimaplasma bacterium]